MSGPFSIRTTLAKQSEPNEHVRQASGITHWEPFHTNRNGRLQVLGGKQSRTSEQVLLLKSSLSGC